MRLSDYQKQDAADVLIYYGLVVVVIFLLVLLAGCAGPSAITKECAQENPMPSSMRVAPFFGIIGLGVAYAVDGPAINQVSAAREQCEQQKAATNAPSVR